MTEPAAAPVAAVPLSTDEKVALFRRLFRGRTRQLKLTSCDRLFPNQDTTPRGGFGNLIALRLQKLLRKSGGSVFVDEALRP